MDPKTTEDKIDSAIARLLGFHNQVQEVHHHHNDGGKAVWICVTAAVLSFVLVVLFGVAVGFLAYVVHAHSMQLNAIYMSVPEIREIVKEHQGEYSRDPDPAAPGAPSGQ